MNISKIRLVGIAVSTAAALLAVVSLLTIHNTPPKEKVIPTISLDATYVKYENVDALDSGAQLIVVGSAVKAFDDRQHTVTTFADGSLQDFYTLTEIKIDRVIKAPADAVLPNGSSLSIIEPISYVQDKEGKKKITIENYSELKENEKSIIFLRRNTHGQYSVINMDLGKFSLRDSVRPISTQKDEKAMLRDSVFVKYNL